MGVPGEADVGGVGQRADQKIAQVAAGGTVGLVDQDVDVLASHHIGRHVVELVDGGDDQATMIVAQQPAQVGLGLGHHHPAHAKRREVIEELLLQFIAVDQHQHRRVLEVRVLHQDPGHGDHGVGLARALGMPDQRLSFGGVGGPLLDPFHRPHLVRSQHRLAQLAVDAGEEDEIGEDAQHARRIEEGGDQGLEAGLASGGRIAGLLVAPVEEELAGGSPGGAVAQLGRFGQPEKLGKRNQLWPLDVVSPDLVQRLVDPVPFGCRLGLDDQDRQAIDQEHDVRPSLGWGAVGEGVFLGHVKGVGRGIIRVDHPHVALPPLTLHEHRLHPAQILPGLEVPVDGGRQARDGAHHGLGALLVHHLGIELLELAGEHVVEHQPGVAVAQTKRLLARQIGPAGVLRVADEGVLDSDAFVAKKGHYGSSIESDDGHSGMQPRKGKGLGRCCCEELESIL